MFIFKMIEAFIKCKKAKGPNGFRYVRFNHII